MLLHRVPAGCETLISVVFYSTEGSEAVIASGFLSSSGMGFGTDVCSGAGVGSAVLGKSFVTVR